MTCKNRIITSKSLQLQYIYEKDNIYHSAPVNISDVSMDV